MIFPMESLTSSARNLYVQMSSNETMLPLDEAGSGGGVRKGWRMNWTKAVVLLLFLVCVHEIGHVMMYVLTTGYAPTISLVFLPDPAVAVNYPVLPPIPFLMTAGGLLILLPFLLLWPKCDLCSRLVILAMVCYASLEML